VKLSQLGLGLIARREQLRLEAYQDGGGVWTIGYGHTGGVHQGDEWTADKALRQLALDVSAAELVVERACSGTASKLDQYEFDALVSLCFNIGGHAFETSTLVQLWHAGASRREIAKQFGRWCKDNGQYVEGLAMRRASEVYQFAGGQ
jgi:lysozyme